MKRFFALTNPFRVCPPAGVIFLYHTVEEKPNAWTQGHRYVTAFNAFKRQIDYLRARFEIISTEELLNRLKKQTLKKPAAAIHFDDGFDSYQKIALPYLKRHNLPSTIFLIQSVLQGSVPFRNQIAYCFNRGAGEKLQKNLGISPMPAAEFLSWSKDHLSYEKRDIVKMCYEDCLSSHKERPPFLGESEIAALANDPCVELGSHTVNHRALATLSEIEQRQEIFQAHDFVEDLAGRKLDFFAYPFGAPHHFNKTTQEIVRERQNLTSFSTYGEINFSFSNTDMKRITLTSDSPWEIEQKTRLETYRSNRFLKGDSLAAKN